MNETQTPHMKTINEKFTDKEHQQLTEHKEKLGIRNWHDYILLTLRIGEDECVCGGNCEEKGGLKNE